MPSLLHIINILNLHGEMIKLQSLWKKKKSRVKTFISRYTEYHMKAEKYRPMQ